MRLRIALLGMLTACDFQSPGQLDGGTPPVDAPSLCFGTFPQICFLTAADVPNAPAVVPADIDTDTGAACSTRVAATAAAYCVVAGSSITIASGEKVRAQGGRPLVLLSTSTITIDGTVDVSSAFNAGAQIRGAGGNVPGCPSGTPHGLAAGGGAGGSFGSKGGDGNVPAGEAAGGGVAPAGLAQPPTTLRGGCAGDPGGATGGAGGFGGGAVSLIARTSITVAATGRINASGAGGQGGPASKAGGGGGGSGGMIVFDAPSSIVTGLVFANGAGGGQGGAMNGAGKDGNEPTVPDIAPLGGTSSKDGGGGGAGGASNKPQGIAAPANAGAMGGGGGGGGASGFIRGRGLTDAPNIAPPASALP
jgi:hypothetical protein